MRTTLTLLATIVAASLFSQPLIVKPAISQDGNQIAFSYQGDIWKVPATGGRADRLTIHEGYDGSPVWMAGNGIAFQSDRYGNNDLFTIPQNGGTPKRLTFHSTSDRLYSATSNSLLFVTRRSYQQVEWDPEIYEVKMDGSTPSRFMDALGSDPIVSPDGSKVAFVRGACRIEREAYRGPANRNVWIWDKNADTYTQLTTFDGNDFNPQWLDDNSIAYISSKSGRYNIHRITLEGQDTQLTKETEWGVNSFSASGQSGRLVYQHGDKVSLFGLENQQKTELSIDVNSDFRFDPVVSKKVSDRVEQFSVSPNGKLIAYVNRGEIFVTRNDKEDSRSVRVTTTPFRDRDVAWLSDEKLIFVSDQNGQNDFFTASSADENETSLFKTLKHQVEIVKRTDEEEFSPVISPDGKKIAFRRGRGTLVVANVSDGGTLSNEKILQDGWDTPGGVSWSPDSKWVAYSLSGLHFNEEIYIHAADNSSEPVNISMHPKYDGNPVWSKDGTKLGFISQRNNGDSDIWFAWLTKADWERSRESRKREEKDDDDEKKDEEDGTVIVKIDFENIYRRLVQVTSFAGNEGDFEFDGEGQNIYYSLGGSGRQNFEVERNLYKIKWDGSDKKEILGGNKRPTALALNAKGDALFMLTSGGKMTMVKTKDDKSETISTSSQLKIDYPKERSQIFNEGWRALNAGFYDPDFHGQDWEALRAKYQPLADKASTAEDFASVFNMMLGQLNSSHMGYRGGDNPKETQRQRSGLIGVDGEHVRGGFKVTSVVENSPADKVESKLNVGDIITSVNQEPITATTNFYSTLIDQIDNPVLLSVTRVGGGSGEVVIWPVSSLRSEMYDEWVEDRRKLVDQYSNGRLGYLHIRGMNWSSFERFERELTAAGYGKEGIVIDVRYNGGGWTTDYLMAVLSVQQHAYTVPRGAAKSLDEHLNFKQTYPFSERLPLASWTKPSIAMCNEYSYSNAEIFSHAYKHLGLGTLVGKSTFGAVISTGGWGLMDGSFVRMPFRGWYVKATEKNMEHGPAVPDIEVENIPAYKAKNVDDQLKKAAEELLRQIDN
ncbi:MAG: S41 family peptidase [Cyclobacteriaceae bacterium]